MKLVIKKEIAETIGLDELAKQFPDLKTNSWHTWRSEFEIDLADMKGKEIDKIEAWLEDFKTRRGVNVLLHDLRVWKTVLKSGAAGQKPRTVKAFEPLLANFLMDVPGHRIYRREGRGQMFCYYVTHIEYQPPERTHGGKMTPPEVIMYLAYDAVGGRQTTQHTFDSGDVIGKTVEQAFLEAGYFVEDAELRAEYDFHDARYAEVAQAIGKQFWAKGDGVDADTSYDRHPVVFDQFGEPSRVVVDVFSEDRNHNSGKSNVNLREYYWLNVKRNSHYNPITDEYSGPEDEDVTLEKPIIEVPTHPWIVVFDLARHRRFKVHVAQLEEYIYDQNLAEKLVLPDDQKNLVKLLIETKGGMFQDIVRGKGGGAVILLTGAPGVGKTLTAEVYAESEERPLYSVQCSQLGTKADDLETKLLATFERARRWNAVLLLDEADVYIRERGNDMQQNAIVGVFLRVLEYQPTTLFLTSNRPDIVDDAIASRCIARLYYKAPDADRAERIWHVLAENSGIPISNATIIETVRNNPGMSGRDIKNILKLANLMLKDGESITEAHIEFVKQFKPTGIVLEKKDA